MTAVMKTSPVMITDEFDWERGTGWIVKSVTLVRVGDKEDKEVEFTFEVFDHGTDEYLLGNIVEVEDLDYMEEVLVNFRANRNHYRYSFKEHYNDKF